MFVRVNLNLLPFQKTTPVDARMVKHAIHYLRQCKYDDPLPETLLPVACAPKMLSRTHLESPSTHKPVYLHE